MAAVLVDAENTSCWKMKEIMNKILEYSEDGNISIRRLYGDFTKPELQNWKNISLEHSLTPVQQYSYVSKKGTSDQKLTIDALKLLYEKNINTFYIVTSDSDFLPLCLELREQGKHVFGIGKKQTPISFVKSCTTFSFIENLNDINDCILNKTHKSAIKNCIQTYAYEDGTINIGFLKEKLVSQENFEKNIKIKKLLLQFPNEIGIFQKDNNMYAYIR